MKKLFFLSLLLLSGIFTSPVHAATPTPTTSDKTVPEKLDKQINQLKEKIASRVSELNLVEKRGVVGTVSEIKGNQITLSDTEGRTRYVDVDEITKFSSAGVKGTFGLSDLTKGTKISILGIYNKQSKRLLARFVTTHVSPIFYNGTISATDTKNFQLTLTTPEQKTVKIDINPSAKITSYTKEEGLVKYGFSKLTVGDRIIVAGFPDKSDPSLLVASRLIVFIGLPKDPKIVTDSNTSSPAATSISPTTESNKKLNPIR